MYPTLRAGIAHTHTLVIKQVLAKPHNLLPIASKKPLKLCCCRPASMMPFTMRILTLIALVGLGLTFWHQYAVITMGQNGESGLAATLDGTLSPMRAFQRIFGVSSDTSSSTVRRRVVAVADLHGDLEHAHNVLRMAGLVDQANVPNWIGGHDILVSTGDIVDRGDDTIALYQMFQRLRVQARQSGGDVLNCIGNHEMMNALMDWRYVTPGDMDSFGGAKARRLAMSREGWIGQDWMANYSISHTIALLPPALVPDILQDVYSVPRASFVHGGIHPHWASLGLTHINEAGHGLLRKALSTARPHNWLPDDATEEEIEFYGENGPLWYRGYALNDERSVCAEADEARHHLAVRHLIMGQ